MASSVSARRGPLVIATMMTLGLVLSGYAWWHQSQLGRRAAEYWGPERTVVVRYGEAVELVALLPCPPEPAAKQPHLDSQVDRDRIEIDGTCYRLDDARDISRTRGLVHARHALVDDLSFDWSATSSTPGKWDYLLRFASRGGAADTVEVVVSAEHGRVRDLRGSKVLTLVPQIAAAFRNKSRDWLQN